MAKARDEVEALQHMTVWAKRGKLSGAHPAWTTEKQKALDAVLRDDSSNRLGGLPRMTMLDIGLGDADVMATWDGLGEVDYLGAEGVPLIARAAAERLGRIVMPATFSDIVDWPATYDCVVALDVFYHIPDEELEAKLVRWMFHHAHRYVVFSHATDPGQDFHGGQKPGDAGFCWFPRWIPVPQGWTVLHLAHANTNQKQRVLALRKDN